MSHAEEGGEPLQSTSVIQSRLRPEARQLIKILAREIVGRWKNERAEQEQRTSEETDSSGQYATP